MISRSRVLASVGRSTLRYGIARHASSIAAAIDEAVEKFPMKSALHAVEQAVGMSYSDLKTNSESLAAGLLDAGLRPGDTVALWVPNTAEGVVAKLAGAKAGLNIAVIDEKTSSADEVASVINDTKARCLIFHPRINKQDNQSLVAKLVPEMADARATGMPLMSRRFPNLLEVVTTGSPAHGFYNFGCLMIKDTRALTKVQVDASTPFSVSYSGGSKGKSLTQGEAVKEAQAVVSRLSLVAADKLCQPSSETATADTLAALLAHAELLIPCADGNQATVDEVVKKNKATVIGGKAGRRL